MVCCASSPIISLYKISYRVGNDLIVTVPRTSRTCKLQQLRFLHHPTILISRTRRAVVGSQDEKPNLDDIEDRDSDDNQTQSSMPSEEQQEDFAFINFTAKTESKPRKKAEALARFLREKGRDYQVDFDVDKDLEYLKHIDDSDDEAEYTEPKGIPNEVRAPIWDKLVKVDYKINEDLFHKINLYHCDFFIKKVPDPDNDLYDFSQMYVTPPDTDVYSIPKVMGHMPRKATRLQKSNFTVIHCTDYIVESPMDDSNREEMRVMKVFLFKHHQNKRAEDEDFFLDFEEIYVIDSKLKSISRATVVCEKCTMVHYTGALPAGGIFIWAVWSTRTVVTVPPENRNRKDEVLIVRDGGTTFKIISKEEQADPDTVIDVIQYERSRERLVNYLRGFRDFSESYWF